MVRVATTAPEPAELRPPEEPLPKPPRKLPAALEPESATPIVVGLVVCVVGFLLIAFAWSQVGLRRVVAEQVPYVVSAGFTGMGFIVVGAVAVSIQVKRRDAADQLRRLEHLAAMLREEREQ
jgi:hypothetical protein